MHLNIRINSSPLLSVYFAPRAVLNALYTLLPLFFTDLWRFGGTTPGTDEETNAE